MSVNPVTGEDRDVPIKEIKDRKRKAFHDSPIFIPPVLFFSSLAQHLFSVTCCRWLREDQFFQMPPAL